MYFLLAIMETKRMGNGLMVKCISIVLMAFGAVMSANASATQSSVPIFECRNCSDTQMQQAALNKPGYGVRIVYNLASGHIFKYNVYLEPGCMNGGEEPQAVASKSDGDAEAGTASTCNQNPSREIEWMPIDTAMLAPFAAMVEVYNDSPALLATAKVEKPIGDVGRNPNELFANFDPYLVAYDRGTGPTFHTFLESARNYFNTHSSLLNSDPSLAAWIYDVLAPLRNLQISIGQQPAVNLDMGTIMQDITIDFVGPDGSYVRVKFTRQPNSEEYEVEFVGAWNSMGVPLPTSQEVRTPGFHRQFRGPGGHEAANNMGDFLNRQGWGSYGPTPIGCRSYILSCIVEPRPMSMCRIDCEN